MEITKVPADTDTRRKVNEKLDAIHVAAGDKHIDTMGFTMWKMNDEQACRAARRTERGRVLVTQLREIDRLL